MGLFQVSVLLLCMHMLLCLKQCIGGMQQIGHINPGFQTSQMDWLENKGIFLLSKNSSFGFGFFTGLDVHSYLLVVIHLKSRKVVWTANRRKLISNSDEFVFSKDGKVYLEKGDELAWSAGTGGQRVSSVELRESGNLVLLGDNGNVLWQSFNHPTDTLLQGQEFVEGMKLQSFPSKDNLYCFLEIKSGDLVLLAGYETPQVYWSLANESRKTNNSVSSKVHSAILESNFWNFYDQAKILLWQFRFSDNLDPNATWSVNLGSRGTIEFYNLQVGRPVTPTPEAVKIPQNPCRIPEPCDRYYVCYFDSWCQCPTLLNSEFSCKPPVSSNCNSSQTSVELFYVGEKLDYFALSFVKPSLKSDLNVCREACIRNCSCTAMFFENSTGSCFMFDQLGSLTRASDGSAGYISYVKISHDGLNTRRELGLKHKLLISIIVGASVVVIAGMIYLGTCYYRKKKKSLMEFPLENLEEDNFLDKFSGTPLRYSFSDLCKATKNFSVKVGQGGFGSVYMGALPDGTRLAIKKLEGVGQGKKEFGAEVNIIGSIHHVHLVKLKGFCAEGAHRLLVYEYLGKGSLDKWIFKNKEESSFLDWNTRFNIALGTAKGLAYLHEECELKIVHCDIKPENILLDDNFVAKVSDFGLAKLMNRDDSLVYTKVRGTRGYLAPEWISNNPISEKSDVYSYGIVLLEIIGGRKNYDSSESSEKSHFPSYSFKMLEEGKLKEIIDPKLDIDESDERVITAIKVALWCIQDDMQSRPPISKVVQMLEGLCEVPEPPPFSQSVRYSRFDKWNSKENSSLGLVDYNSEAFLSDIRLSGPK